MSVTGDFAGLQRVAAELRALSAVRRRTAIVSAAKIKKLTNSEFKTGTDPYGQPWTPLKPSTIAKTGRTQPLSTGAKRFAVSVFSTIAKITASSAASLIDLFQRGTRHMAARPILPTEGQGAPATWDKKVAESWDIAVARALKALQKKGR